METRTVVKRDWSRDRQTCRIHSWGGVLERRIHPSPSAAVPMGADLGGTRRNFSRPGHGALDPAACRQAWSSAIDHQSGNPPPWGATAIEPLRLTSGRGIAPNAPSVVGSRHSHRSSDLSRANCSWIGRPNKLQVGSSGNFPRKRLCGFPTKPSTGVCLFEPGGVLKKEPMGHLRSRRRMRRAQSASTASQPCGQIVDGVSIRDRPADVEDRAIPGHWEGDLITAAQNTHLATLVERRSRFTMLVKVPGKDTIGVMTALSAQIQHDLPLISWTPGYATAALASYSAGE